MPWKRVLCEGSVCEIKSRRGQRIQAKAPGSIMKSGAWRSAFPFAEVVLQRDFAIHQFKRLKHYSTAIGWVFGRHGRHLPRHLLVEKFKTPESNRPPLRRQAPLPGFLATRKYGQAEARGWAEWCTSSLLSRLFRSMWSAEQPLHVSMLHKSLQLPSPRAGAEQDRF